MTPGGEWIVLSDLGFIVLLRSRIIFGLGAGPRQTAGITLNISR